MVSLNIYQLYIEDEKNDLDYYDEYFSQNVIDKDSVVYCIGTDVTQKSVNVVNKHINNVFLLKDNINQETLEIIFLIESLLREKYLFVLSDPLDGKEYDATLNANLCCIYENIKNLSNTNILSEDYISTLRVFSECIDKIESPLWRGNFRTIYRYLSYLNEAVTPFYKGALNNINSLSEFNILKSARSLAKFKFPQEQLDLLGGSSKPHKNHLGLQRAIKMIANDFHKSIDNGEFPLFYLWIFFMFDLKVRAHINNGALSDAIVFLVRIIEVTAQSVLLTQGYIKHKGYGRFCKTNGDDRNLLGAGAYLKLLEDNALIKDLEANLFNKVIRTRNQLSSAHGFASLVDVDILKYYDFIKNTTKKLIRNNVKNNIYDGFEDMISAVDNFDIIKYFLDDKVNEYKN